MEILRHTPVWVFILFVVLLGFGYFQSRPRVARRTRIVLVPGAMILLSLYGVLSAFGPSALGIGGWLIGVGLAILLNRLLGSPRGASYSVATDSFQIPGSWLPLALMMAIFFTKYGVAVAIAREPAVVNTPLFIGGVSVLYGVWSGLFFARLLRMLRIAKEAKIRAA